MKLNSLRASSVFVVTLLLTACATGYVPPTEPVPAGWTGLYGFEALPGTTRFHLGVREKGDAIYELGVKLVRTGIITEEVRTKNAYGHDLIIPKGTKAFAVNYTLVERRGGVAQKIDPIEWCVNLPDGIDGKDDGSQTVCIFWENEQSARYFEDFGKNQFRFLIHLRKPSGMPGPIPKITEESVDFGVTIKRQVRIANVDKQGLRLEYVLTDGMGLYVEKVLEPRWDENQRINISYGPKRMNLSPSSDFKSVNVEEQ